MIRAASLLLALFALAACATDELVPQAKKGTCSLTQLAQMPIELRGNMLFVQADIDQQPVSLLVDTGAERTLLTEAAVNRLRLPRDHERATRTLGIGTATATWDAKLPTGLVLGDTRFPLDSVTVGHFEITGIGGGSADGLLGADILLAFDIDLDMPAQRITFYRARAGCADASPPWNEAYVGVAGVDTRRDRLMVPFQLDGMNGVGVLDTGAQVSSISQHMVQRLGLAETDMAADRVVMAHGAAPDQVKVRVHRFREFRVGPAVMEGPALPVVPMSSGMGDALVGGDFLQGRRVWLSFSTRRIFVTPLEQGPWIAVTRTGG